MPSQPAADGACLFTTLFVQVALRGAIIDIEMVRISGPGGIGMANHQNMTAALNLLNKVLRANSGRVYEYDEQNYPQTGRACVFWHPC
jgi:hypothetical protein